MICNQNALAMFLVRGILPSTFDILNIFRGVNENIQNLFVSALARNMVTALQQLRQNNHSPNQQVDLM
jgi:hypothetical protein